MMKDDLAGASGGETSILFTSRLQRAGLLLVPRSLQLRLPGVRAIHATLRRIIKERAEKPRRDCKLLPAAWSHTNTPWDQRVKVRRDSALRRLHT